MVNWRKSTKNQTKCFNLEALKFLLEEDFFLSPVAVFRLHVQKGPMSSHLLWELPLAQA